jgi:hypothetical protein
MVNVTIFLLASVTNHLWLACIFNIPITHSLAELLTKILLADSQAENKSFDRGTIKLFLTGLYSSLLKVLITPSG